MIYGVKLSVVVPQAIGISLHNNYDFKYGARMEKTIILFGNLRVNEVMGATRTNEYCKRNILEETLNLHGLWGDDSD